MGSPFPLWFSAHPKHLECVAYHLPSLYTHTLQQLPLFLGYNPQLPWCFIKPCLSASFCTMLPFILHSSHLDFPSPQRGLHTLVSLPRTFFPPISTLLPTSHPLDPSSIVTSLKILARLSSTILSSLFTVPPTYAWSYLFICVFPPPINMFPSRISIHENRHHFCFCSPLDF